MLGFFREIFWGWAEVLAGPTVGAEKNFRHRTPTGKPGKGGDMGDRQSRECKRPWTKRTIRELTRRSQQEISLLAVSV